MYELIEPVEDDDEILKSFQEDIATIKKNLLEHKDKWMKVARSDSYYTLRSLADANWTNAIEDPGKRHSREVVETDDGWELFVIYKPGGEVIQNKLVEEATENQLLLCKIVGELARKNGYTVNPNAEYKKNWLQAARLVLERAVEVGRTEESVIELAKWAMTHHFWMQNIRSVPKFYDQYDRLREQANRDAQGSGWSQRRAEISKIWDNHVSDTESLWDGSE